MFIFLFWPNVAPFRMETSTDLRVETSCVRRRDLNPFRESSLCRLASNVAAVDGELVHPLAALEPPSPGRCGVHHGFVVILFGSVLFF